MSKAKQKRQNVGIVTGPIDFEAGNIPLSNLIDILRPLSDNICVITGNKGGVISGKYEEGVRFFTISHKSSANIFSRATNFVYTQFRIAYRLGRLARSVPLWVFVFGETLVLPVLLAKLLGGKVILLIAMNVSRMSQAKKDPLGKVLVFLKTISCFLSDRLIVYSERLITEHGLQKYRGKISISNRHFLDFSAFRILKPLHERERVVGYIGRLGKEKGILNFLEAIPKVLSEREDVTFLIGGDGELKREVEEYLGTRNLGNRVRLVGWIPHDEVPAYLNELKLLVLPSYTEGLPNTALEAMSCGTPVLATPVGAIPDVIKHEQTGFIMENNSSECITRNVVRVLDRRDLEQITINARQFVRKEYNYGAAVERYRNILAVLKPK